MGKRIPERGLPAPNLTFGVDSTWQKYADQPRFSDPESLPPGWYLSVCDRRLCVRVIDQGGTMDDALANWPSATGQRTAGKHDILTSTSEWSGRMPGGPLGPDEQDFIATAMVLYGVHVGDRLAVPTVSVAEGLSAMCWTTGRLGSPICAE